MSVNHDDVDVPADVTNTHDETIVRDLPASHSPPLGEKEENETSSSRIAIVRKAEDSEATNGAHGGSAHTNASRSTNTNGSSTAASSQLPAYPRSHRRAGLIYSSTPKTSKMFSPASSSPKAAPINKKNLSSPYSKNYAAHGGSPPALDVPAHDTFFNSFANFPGLNPMTQPLDEQRRSPPLEPLPDADDFESSFSYSLSNAHAFGSPLAVMTDTTAARHGILMERKSQHLTPTLTASVPSPSTGSARANAPAKESPFHGSTTSNGESNTTTAVSGTLSHSPDGSHSHPHATPTKGVSPCQLSPNPGAQDKRAPVPSKSQNGCFKTTPPLHPNSNGAKLTVMSKEFSARSVSKEANGESGRRTPEKIDVAMEMRKHDTQASRTNSIGESASRHSSSNPTTTRDSSSGCECAHDQDEDATIKGLIPSGNDEQPSTQTYDSRTGAASASEEQSGATKQTGPLRGPQRAEFVDLHASRCVQVSSVQEGGFRKRDSTDECNGSASPPVQSVKARRFSFFRQLSGSFVGSAPVKDPRTLPPESVLATKATPQLPVVRAEVAVCSSSHGNQQSRSPSTNKTSGKGFTPSSIPSNDKRCITPRGRENSGRFPRDPIIAGSAPSGNGERFTSSYHVFNVGSNRKNHSVVDSASDDDHQSDLESEYNAYRARKLRRKGLSTPAGRSQREISFLHSECRCGEDESGGVLLNGTRRKINGSPIVIGAHEFGDSHDLYADGVEDKDIPLLFQCCCGCLCCSCVFGKCCGDQLEECGAYLYFKVFRRFYRYARKRVVRGLYALNIFDGELPSITVVYCLGNMMSTLVVWVLCAYMAIYALNLTRPILIADGSVCERVVFNDREMANLTYTLLTFAINAGFTLWFSIRAARYEKTGILFAHLVAMLLQLSRLFYFSTTLTATYFDKNTSLAMTGLLVFAGVVLFLSTCLSYWVYRGFGWRTYKKGITQSTKIERRRLHMYLESCIQTDTMITINIMVAAVYLLDDLAMQITSAVLALLTLASLTLLLRMIRRQETWFFYFFCGLAVVTMTFYVYMISNTMDTYVSRNTLEHYEQSVCYTSTLPKCLQNNNVYIVSPPAKCFENVTVTYSPSFLNPSMFPVHDEQHALSSGTSQAVSAAGAAVVAKGLSLVGRDQVYVPKHEDDSIPFEWGDATPFFPPGVVVNPMCLLDTGGRTGNHSAAYPPVYEDETSKTTHAPEEVSISVTEEYNVSESESPDALPSGYDDLKPPQSTLIPSYSVKKEYFEVRTCNASCYLNDEFVITHKIMECCGHYGSCRLREEIRVYVAFTVIALAALGILERLTLIVLGWRRITSANQGSGTVWHLFRGDSSNSNNNHSDPPQAAASKTTPTAKQSTSRSPSAEKVIPQSASTPHVKVAKPGTRDSYAPPRLGRSNQTPTAWDSAFVGSEQWAAASTSIQ